jgi:molybdenum transport protein
MIRFSDARIDDLIAEDVPYCDLTTDLLGIGEQKGRMEYFTREDCTVAGAYATCRVAERLGLAVEGAARDGDRVQAGSVLVTLAGTASQLHMAWKVGQNLLDHLSAVATKTRAMVDAAHAANPRCEILTTRKSMPGAKDLLTSAVMAGGAWPHRLGTSETVLVFANHTAFLGGFESLVEALPALRAKCVEKKVFVEAGPEEALVLARGKDGAPLVDGIQLDKVPAAELADLVARLRAIDPRLTLIAAGGINPANAAEYAATGVDGIVTTAPFSAKPLDMSARMCADGGSL